MARAAQHVQLVAQVHFSCSVPAGLQQGELIDSAIVKAWQHPFHPANISGSLTGKFLPNAMTLAFSWSSYRLLQRTLQVSSKELLLHVHGGACQSSCIAGNWQLHQNASEGIQLAMAEKGGGRSVLQLTTTGTSVAGLHDVKVGLCSPLCLPSAMPGGHCSALG